MTSRTLTDAAALVTGASRGVGLSVSRELVRRGARVALVAPDADALEDAVGELRARGADAVAIVGDVSTPDACARIVRDAVATFGRLDVLVNNAGVHVRGPFGDLDVADVAAMVDVNARAPLVLTAHALPHLRKSRGAVVNVASIAGMAPLPGAAVYSSTKFALRVFSMALAEELRGTGVSVSVVSPGPIIDTGFLMDHVEDAADIVFSQPMSTAAEVADMVIACALDGRRERAKPRATSVLTNISYLMPGLRRVLEPAIRRRGSRAKARILRERER